MTRALSTRLPHAATVRFERGKHPRRDAPAVRAVWRSSSGACARSAPPSSPTPSAPAPLSPPPPPPFRSRLYRVAGASPAPPPGARSCSHPAPVPALVETPRTTYARCAAQRGAPACRVLCLCLGRRCVPIVRPSGAPRRREVPTRFPALGPSSRAPPRPANACRSRAQTGARALGRAKHRSARHPSAPHPAGEPRAPPRAPPHSSRK